MRLDQLIEGDAPRAAASPRPPVETIMELTRRGHPLRREVE